MLQNLKKVIVSIGTVLFAPVRAVLELVDWVGFSARAENDGDSETKPEALWRRLVLLPFRMVSATVSSLGHLVRVPLLGVLQNRRRQKYFYLGLPALGALVAFVFVVSNQILARGSNDARYAAAFDQAEQEGDNARAKAIGSHMVREGVRANPEASFRLCKLLANANELERANAIIDIIAPNDAPGYPPAHEQRAIAYASLVTRGAGPQALPVLLWHLNQSGNRNSEALNLARATYYRATGQLDMCIRAVEAATRLNAAHAFSLSELYAMRGDQANADRAIKLARDDFRRQLAKDPLSKTARLQLIQALLRSRQYDEAEQTLQAGIELFPDDADLRRAQSTLDLVRYEQTTPANMPEDQRLDQLLKLLVTVEDPTVVFDRMIQFYNSTGTAENRDRIRSALEDQAARQETNAVLQFALSVIAIREERIDDAIGLLERTLELDPKNHLAMNNLAWLIAERQPPALDRALELAESAVAALPSMANYRDTLGNVLFLRGDMQRAITELELALSGMPEKDRAKIQARIAAAHRQLGNDSLAELYQLKSEGKSK